MKTIQLRKLLILVGLTLLLTASLGGIVSAAPSLAPAFQADGDAGVLILAVRDNSPADKAGLVRGDIVLAIDDETVDAARDLAAVIQEFTVGDEIIVSVLHGDEIVERTVILGERNNRTYLGVQPYVATDGETVGEDDENADNTEDIDGEEADEADIDNPVDDDEAENESPDSDNAGVEEQGDPMADLLGLLPADLAGAIVAEVVAASPADETGLAVGDVIVAVDGEAVTAESDLATLIAVFSPGDEVTLDVLANGVQDDEAIELVVTLGAHPEDEERAYLGIAYMLAPAMMDDLRELPFAPRGTSPEDGENNDNSADEQLEDDNAGPDGMMPEGRLGQLLGMGGLGAVIGDVLEESPAAEAGLASGDVILSVDGEEVSPEADLATLIGNYEPGDEVTLEMRAPDAEENDTFEVVVTLGAHPEDEDRAFLGISYMPTPMMFDRDGMQFDDMLPFMPRFRDMPQDEGEEGQREDHDYHHRDHQHRDYQHRDHHQDEGESCNEGCPHGQDEGFHEEMMPFHELFGFEDFDLDGLSEDELEMLQEIFPFLFSDEEAAPESDGDL